MWPSRNASCAWVPYATWNARPECDSRITNIQTFTSCPAMVMVWMFVMRLSHSGRAFHVAYGTQAQEAFLEGHVLAFQHFGGVPGRIRYDNLGPAVTRILKGRNRDEAERFVALRSHYGFESFFCQPGLKGAHE